MTDSNLRLERRYRRMLRFYPRSYREQHGEDMLGVLMTGAEQDGSRSRLAASLDLLRGAVLVHTRYWWEMRSNRASDSLAVRHALLVIRIRLAVAVWLCIVTGLLCSQGDWWGLGILVFVALHLLFAGRIAVRYRTR